MPRGSSPLSRGILVVLWTGREVRGSSPLSRGILGEIDTRWRERRIIPALAGNTPGGAFSPSIRGDHPRSRGEYEPVPGRGGHGGGSSPLSRGIPYPNNRSGRTPRIIPALAGNTPHRLQHSLFRKDHPRSRGEYITGPRSSCWLRGSSPLSRGIRRHRGARRRRHRIIPALAGNTPE